MCIRDSSIIFKIGMMKDGKKLILGFIDREKPGTWIFAIIVAMLTVPLAVTLILYFTMQ